MVSTALHRLRARRQIREAGSEQHIRSNFFEGFKAANGFTQVWISVGEIVRSRGQRERERESTGSLCGRSNAFDRQAEIIQWPIGVASRILDRASNEPHVGRTLDRLNHDFR